MIPTYRECDLYYFDEQAAERPIQLAEKHLFHHEGKTFAGKPFVYLDWQKQLTRTLFGWKRKSDGRRRFTEMYLLTAKGAGKTPWLASIGMYLFLCDDEPGAEVISAATDFAQASLTFDAGKTWIKENKKLAKIAEPMQYVIKGPKNSKWKIVSGTAEGKHGLRPSGLLMDEAHEWPNGQLYTNLTANMPKREQPLTLVITNAGKSQASFCYQLHQRAQKALKGEDPTLLPVIFEAPLEMDWRSEEAAAAANPSLGSITRFEGLKPELAKARLSAENKSTYCRLFLSQWPGVGAGGWLNLFQWDNAVTAWTDPPADAPLYIGVDLSQLDDLCAVVCVYPTPDRLYVRAHFWMPRETAERDEAEHGIPYAEWAAAGHITLLDQPTIDEDAHRQISDHIIAARAGREVKAVCFDRYRADQTVANLEAAELICVGVAQGYTVSPACNELQRRLKQGTLAIAQNPVFRFCAENAQAQQDTRGNLSVVKPGGSGGYAGLRWKKVDGISALVTGMVEARKFSFPAKSDIWQGTVERCRA